MKNVGGACAIKVSHARPLVREREVGESTGVPTSALIVFVALLTHSSVCLRAFPQLLIATGVRSRHTDVC